MSEPIKFEVGRRVDRAVGVPSWETNVYGDESKLDIGNGDPVIVHSDSTGAVCLGTGHTGLHDIIHATVMTIGVTGGETFEVFLPAGSAFFTENDGE
jgi:hypothetical protein